MRKLLLAFLLFQAADSFAQTISAEIESGPLPLSPVAAPIAAPRVALAKDRSGVAIAWITRTPDGQRVSVVRLDAAGRFTGQLRTIPSTTLDPTDVTTVSIASSPTGDGFTLAWLETSPIQISVPYRVAYCFLDSALKPSLPMPLLTFFGPLTAPPIVRAGKSTWITAGQFVAEIRNDGSPPVLLNAGAAATDMTVATDFPQLISSRRDSVDAHICGTGPNCFKIDFFRTCLCPVFKTTYSLDFTSLFTVTASNSFSFDSDAAPAIGNDSHDVAVVWLQGPHKGGGSVVMARLLPSAFSSFPAATNSSQVIGSFGADVGATRPDIASDVERYVVVWRTGLPDGSHDIVGASVDRAGRVTPLSIATSEADERDPSVIAMGGGTFLVTYEKTSGAEQRIAGRFVTFGPPRVRAVR